MASADEMDPLLPVRKAFDARHYLTSNPDVASSGHDPFDHFMSFGWREGRNPTPSFSMAAYGALNPDVAAAVVNPFVHHVLHSQHEDRAIDVTPSSGSESGGSDGAAEVAAAFDETFYRAQNPDVDLLTTDPLMHFLESGWRDGRDPAPWFSLSAYMNEHPDVRETGANPFVHFILFGRAEGRSLGDRPSPGSRPAARADAMDLVRREFDAAFYLNESPDLSLQEVDAFDHFMEAGWREGRDPNPDFSVVKYLSLNPDVEAAGLNPFHHYISHGRAEGRPTHHGFDFRNDILRNTPPFEDHLAMLRRSRPDPEADPIGVFRQAWAHRSASTRLHVTASQDNYAEMFGGIQLCLRLESAAVRKDGADHLHVFPASLGMVVEIERDHPPIGVALNGAFLGVFAPADLIQAIRDIRKPATVGFAIHSLIGHCVPDLIGILEALGAEEGLFWVHDYSSLCAGYALMRNNVSFCGAPPPESAACGICMYRPRRRIQIQEHVRLFERFSIGVVAPSDTALSLWRKSFPGAASWSMAHPHATLVAAEAQRGRSPDPEGPLRIGFLGMPSHHKGWPVFAALVEAFHLDARYEFHHLAHRPAPGGTARFTEVTPTSENPTPMSEAVADLALDVAIIWSLWPETFCFTAFEAVAGGALVLTNPGAGNVTTFARDPSRGRVLASEEVLFDMVRSGELIDIVSGTPPLPQSRLSYSGMSADISHAARQ